MTPIYFPHTYIPKSIMAALHTCFSLLTFYLPSRRGIPPAMQEWEQNGWIELRSPPQVEEESLSSALREFRNWAAMHGNQDRAGFDYIRSQMGRVPFFDGSSVAQIQADIRGSSSTREASSVSRFFSARVFLGIAQEMDIDAEALAHGMQRHDSLERKLYSELTGAIAAFPPPTDHETTGMHAHLDHMFRERLMAWWVLSSSLSQSAGDDLSRIFVSSSRAVVDYLIDNSTGSVELLSKRKIPVLGSESAALDTWRRGLLDRLRTVALADQPDESLADIDWPAIPEESEPASILTLTIFLFPGMTPTAFFQGATERSEASVPERSSISGSKNTLLVLIEV